MAQIQIFSDTWFEMIEQANSKIGELHLSPVMKEICLNMTITQNPEPQNAKQSDEKKEVATSDNSSTAQVTHLHLLAGCLHQGLNDTAKSAISLSHTTMKPLLESLDMNQALQEFINGKIQVTGDMSQLMALQMAKISDEQKLLFKTILDNTTI